MKYLPLVAIAACTNHCLPDKPECRPQIEAVEQKCRDFGPLGTIEPELSRAQECIGGKVEAVCVQHNVAEPRQVEWTFNKE